MHDVIVVGAGPIGSYTAYLLARQGLDVGIFEKNPSIGKDVNCTGIISAECLEQFHLSKEVSLRPVLSIKAVSPSGNHIRYDSVSPLAHVVNRSLFDNVINRMAVQEGATVYLNTKAEGIEVTDDAFIIRTRTDGEEREFSSRVGVIANGFELQSLHGKHKKDMEYMFGIQADVLMENIHDVEVYFGEKIAPGSFGWVVPTNGKSAKIGLIVQKNPAYFLKSFLESNFIKHRLLQCGPVKCSPIPMKRIPKSFGERLVTVGEAAGQVKATTGGGIYFGFICSEIAAKTIQKAFRNGDFSENMLGEYESNWRKKIAPELKAGLLLRSIFSRFSDRQIDILVDLAKRDGVIPIIKKAHFDWHRSIVNYLIRHLIRKQMS